MSIIQEYCKLARLHSSVLSGLAPVLGAISVGMIEIPTLIIIFLAGLCTHIFGFVLNEYIDIDIDSRSTLLKDKPLVSGTISKNAAIIYAFSGVILGYILIIYLMLSRGYFGLFGLVFYTLSWLSIGIYDLTSKSVRGSDLALALWTGSLCLFGGFAVSTKPHQLLFIISGLAFFQLFIQNILAGLKDISHDKLSLVSTTPLRMGVELINNRLHVTPSFQIYIYSLKLLHFIIVFIPFIFLWLKVNMLQIFFILFLLGINFVLVFGIFNAPFFNRDTLLRRIGLHEILSYSIVPILFFGIIDLFGILFLIIFPIIWLALLLKIIYGRLLPRI